MQLLDNLKKRRANGRGWKQSMRTCLALLMLSTMFLLGSCGGDGGDGGDGGKAIQTGVFLDSAVEGVQYRTSSGLEGVTNGSGQYKYKLGDTVEFTIGNVQLGSVSAGDLVTVFDLNKPEEVAMLLQSLDEDSNPNNGIQISKETFQKFNNAKFTISEVNPESIAFTKKYSSLTGKDFTINRDSAKQHAINTLKKELINKIDPQLLQYITNNQYNNASNLLGTGKNPKDYVKSLRAKLRLYFTFEYIDSFLGADIEVMNATMNSTESAKISVIKKINNTTDKWANFLAIAGLTSSGYKNLIQLKQLKTAFASSAKYVPTALLTKLFKGTALEVTGTIITNKTLESFVSITDDPKLNKKLLDCVGALVPDGFSQVQCFSRLSGELRASVNNLFYDIQSIQALRKRNALYVIRRYLDIYYAFDASNHPQVLAEAFTQMAKNKLPAGEVASYQFATFDPSNNADLEKALDLLAIIGGFSTIDYSFIEAKNNIAKYHTLIEKMTNDYIDNIGLDLLNAVDNKYLGVKITLEPSINNNYKACANLENISNANLKNITGNLNFQLDGVAFGTSTTFTINSLKTINNFEQRCSEPFAINNTGSLLSLGLIKVNYNIKYLPVLYGSVVKNQIGSEYFEINKRMFALATSKPIIKLLMPATAKSGQTVQLDASQTTSLYLGDVFSYNWEYLSSNKLSVNLVNPNSSTTSFIVPKLPSGKLVSQLKFRITVTSLNGLSSSKEVYIYAAQGKDIVQDTIKPNVIAPANKTLTLAQGSTSILASNIIIKLFLNGATATDHVGVVGNPPVTNNAPTSFPIGTTTVTFTAKDAAGNIGTATSTVTIKSAVIAPLVTKLSPATAVIGQDTAFTITGTNLPKTTAMSLFDAAKCGPVIHVNGAGTSATVNCIPGVAGGVGNKPFYIKDKSGGTILSGASGLTVSVTVAPPASSKATLIASKLFNIPVANIIAAGNPPVGANYAYNPWGAVDATLEVGCHGYIGGHAGIDMQTKDVAGTLTANRTFYAVSSGTVITAGGGNFNTIAIYDAVKNITVLYLHARSVSVVNGATVAVGDALGIQGSTGVGAAEHVHLEVRSGRKIGPACGKTTTIDPVSNIIPYLKATSAATNRLNDTGITTWGNATVNNLTVTQAAFPGQDADHGRDALAAAGTLVKKGAGRAGFDFTKLDAAGQPLANQAALYVNTPWSCVQDNVTGMMWEVKTGGGLGGLRDANYTYTWYNSTGINDGGNQGTASGGSCTGGTGCDTEKYVTDVNALTVGNRICGFTDWRLPTRDELLSIVDYSVASVNNTIDTGYFPNTVSGWVYWSASPYAGVATNAWSVDFHLGYGSIDLKSSNLDVRLVRGGQ